MLHGLRDTASGSNVPSNRAWVFSSPDSILWKAGSPAYDFGNHLGGRVLFDGLNDFKNVIAPRRLEGRIRPVRTCDQEVVESQWFDRSMLGVTL